MNSPDRSSEKSTISPTQNVSGETKFETKSEIQGLFEKLGIHYAPRTIFSKDCAIFKETKRADYIEYNKGMKISQETFERYSQQLREGFKAPVYVKWTSDVVGYGIFASEAIAAGTLIMEYTGVVCLKDQVKNRTWSWKYPSRGKFIDGFPSKVSLDGGGFGNELRFLNHSDHRNTSPVLVHNGTCWVNCYFARKAIAKDQELLVSYGQRYWKNRVKMDL